MSVEVVYTGGNVIGFKHVERSERFWRSLLRVGLDEKVDLRQEEVEFVHKLEFGV